jgi:hypothetical protein
MVEAKHRIEFIGNAARAAASGGMAAVVGYQFRLDGKIKVTVWASPFVGKLSQDQVRELASKQIETELGNGADFADGAELEFKP